MPSASKIPQNINKYAVQQLFRIRNKFVENLALIDFEPINKSITRDSDFIAFERDEIKGAHLLNPKDLALHNHPSGYYIPSIEDIKAALTFGLKKLYTASSSGFSSIDFTTAKKSLSADDMLELVTKKEYEFENQWNNYMLKNSLKRGLKRILFKPVPDRLTWESENCNKYQSMFKNKIIEFSKITGTTLSDVKWSDYDKVRLKCEP